MIWIAAERYLSRVYRDAVVLVSNPGAGDHDVRASGYIEGIGIAPGAVRQRIVDGDVGQRQILTVADAKDMDGPVDDADSFDG